MHAPSCPPIYIKERNIDINRFVGHKCIFIFSLFRDNCLVGGERVREERRDGEKKKVTNILSILRDGGRLFLNVTASLKVCPGLARGAAPGARLQESHCCTKMTHSPA